MTLDNGYKMVSTFWQDFCIADVFGVDAIKDTFKRAFNEWKKDHVYLTELVIVLNHKIFAWYEKNNVVAKLYSELWEQADAYAMDNLKGEELDFFLKTTDQEVYMKYENGIYAGSLLEFFQFIQEKIYEDCNKYKYTDFKNVDMAFCHTYQLSDLKAHTTDELKDDEDGWFGVKVLNPGFDSTSTRQFCSDFYGGGDFACCDIYIDDADRSYVNKEVEEMLLKTFKGHGKYTDLCVWEENYD